MPAWPDKSPQPISRRAVVIGALAVIAFTVAGCFSVFLRYEIIGTGYLPRGAIAIIFVLLLGRACVAAVTRRAPFTRAELAVIFIMLLAMAAIPGQEYAQHMYLNLVGFVYYTTPDIAKPELYLDSLNPLLVPSVDRLAPEVRWAFEGLPPGQRIPYRAWVRPLAVWTPYLLAMYWMLLCLAAVLAPRWEEQEKLLYPLMQVPHELLDVSTGTLPSLLRNKLLWMCFALSASLYVLKGLHSYFPAVPDINLQRTTQQLFTGGPAVAFNWMPLHIYPEMIGIAYLLTSEVGFSLWFFYLFRLLQEVTRNTLGVTTGHYDFYELQCAGGYAVLALALVWSARRHLAATFAYACGRGPQRTDAAQAQPYRLAALGFVAGLLFILVWAWQVGLSLGWGLMMFGLLPAVQLVVARVICEAGMFIYSSPFRLNELIFRLGGTDRIGARNVTLMTAMSWLQIRSTATQFMPQAFQGLKLSALVGLQRSHVMWLMVLAIVVALLTCHIVAPYVIYTWGVPKLGWWPRGSSLWGVNRLVSFIVNPTTTRPVDWCALAGGGALMVWLVVMRQRFVWWPFHPAGYVAWLGWPIDRYWLSIFIGWAVKRLVLRFMGYRAFAALRPAAFGLILGICFILTFWLVFHFFVEGPPLVIE